jgi:ribosomal protein S27AE
MPRARRKETEAPAGSPGNPIPLPKSKKLLQRYYEGGRLPSPMGGRLEVLGVREGQHGRGRVMLECSASSLRFLLQLPRASREEREAVAETLAEGNDPTCPRHGPSQGLSKQGKRYLCPRCGVTFARLD